MVITVGAFSFCPMLKFYPKCLAVTINNRTFAAVNDLSIIVWIKKNISTSCHLYCFGM